MCYFMDLSIGSIVPYFDEENQQLIETCPTDVPLQQNTENEETILSVNSIVPYFDEENRQTETLIETCPTKGPCHQNRDQLQSVSMIGVRLEDQSDLSSILTEFPQGDQQLSGVIGQEEFWFAESLESEEFWIDQLPCEANDCVTVVSTESVRETQNMQRLFLKKCYLAAVSSFTSLYIFTDSHKLVHRATRVQALLSVKKKKCRTNR